MIFWSIFSICYCLLSSLLCCFFYCSRLLHIACIFFCCCLVFHLGFHFWKLSERCISICTAIIKRKWRKYWLLFFLSLSPSSLHSFSFQCILLTLITISIFKNRNRIDSIKRIIKLEYTAVERRLQSNSDE